MLRFRKAPQNSLKYFDEANNKWVRALINNKKGKQYIEEIL